MTKQMTIVVTGALRVNCPKISYTSFSDKVAYANNADPDQTAPERQSNQGLLCL